MDAPAVPAVAYPTLPYPTLPYPKCYPNHILLSVTLPIPPSCYLPLPPPLPRFLPLADLYKKRYAMDGPAVPAVPDDCAGSVRIRGLKAFAAAVSGEPLSTLSDLRYEEDLAGMGGSHRDRSEYSGRSESSTASSGRIMHDGRPFEIALRQQGPSSQHSRAPPGMGSAHGSATGSVLSAGGGERGNRSLSGPGPVGAGYFGSGGSIGGGSDGEGWRSSKGSGLGGGWSGRWVVPPWVRLRCCWQ